MKVLGKMTWALGLAAACTGAHAADAVILNGSGERVALMPRFDHQPETKIKRTGSNGQIETGQLQSQTRIDLGSGDCLVLEADSKRQFTLEIYLGARRTGQYLTCTCDGTAWTFAPQGFGPGQSLKVDNPGQANLVILGKR